MTEKSESFWRALRKHTIYSLREIFLVVIGILLAVHFNNLNEQSKSKQKEIEILTEIAQDLTKDTADLNENIGEYSQMMLECENFFSAVASSNGIPEYKEIFKYVLEHDNTFQTHNTGYLMAVDQGISIITDIELRSQIIDLYNLKIKNVMYYENESEFTNMMVPLRNTFFPYIGYDPSTKSNSYSIELITDKKILHQLNVWNKTNYAKKYLSAKLIEDIKAVMEKIEQELERLG